MLLKKQRRAQPMTELSRNNPKTISNPKTPWQRAFAHMGLSIHGLANELEISASTISRSLRDEDGLISGKNQKKLIALGEKIGRPVPPHVLLPDY
jgi:hypothetical protein